MKLFYELLFPSFFRLNVAAAVAGSAVVGAAASSAASSKASKAQSNAANSANALSQQQFEQTRQDNEPFRQNGVLANNQLANRLGILTDKYGMYGNTRYDPSAPFASAAANAEYTKLSAQNGQQFALQQIMDGWNAGLKPVSDEEHAAYQAQQKSDPNFGALDKPFSQSDLDNDPIYQNTFKYALDSGTKGINQQAAATGGILNGNTLKALTRFGANTAATYGNDSFNRDSATKTRIYNNLAGMSGAGQQATAQVNAAGQSNAQYQGNNLIGAGNARGASAISGANGFNNALGTGVNAYQQQNLLNSFGNNSAFDASNGYGSQMNYINGQL